MRNQIEVVILVIISSLSSAYHNGDKKIVCYYRSDNIYRSEGFRMQPQEIDPDLCTHIIYYTAQLHPDEAITSSDPYIDLTRGGYKNIIKLKERNSDLQILLSLRSDPNDRDFWPLIAEHSQTRQWFSARVISFLREHSFDGLDIVWHVPNDQMSPVKYLQLLQDLRHEMDEESEKYKLKRLQLSVFLPAQIQQLHRHFLLYNASQCVDFINVASMDYWALDPYTVQHHAPLYMNLTEGSLSPINVDESIKYYLYKGVDPDKIVLGVPTYGRSFTLQSRSMYNMGSHCTYPGERGFASNMPGTLAYFEICTYIKEDLWLTGNLNLTSMGPYAYSGSRWVGYDDVAIVSKKGSYARNQGLGGLMFWTIDQDDFRCYCNSKFPLIRAGKLTLETGIEVRNQEMLRDEEERFIGYRYPKPTITQPGLGWEENSTTPTYHTFTTDSFDKMDQDVVKPSATSEKPFVEIPTSKPTALKPTRKPTTSKKPKKKPKTTTSKTFTSKPSSSSLNPSSWSSNPPPPSRPEESDGKPNDLPYADDLLITITSPKPTGASSPSTGPQSSSLGSQSKLIDSHPKNQFQSSTTGFPPQPSQPEFEENSAINAINQLNKVLDTVNQVITNINEVNNASIPNRNITTIDPSFLQILQPLLNLKNRVEYPIDIVRPGRNSTITVDSDIKRYNLNNSTVPLSVPVDQLIPLLKNKTAKVNTMNSQTSIPVESLGTNNVMISGRDIVTINLNITINNNYYRDDN